MLKRKVYAEPEFCKRQVVILSQAFFEYKGKLHSVYIADDIAMFFSKNNITNLFEACKALKQFPESPSYFILYDLLNQLK